MKSENGFKAEWKIQNINAEMFCDSQQKQKPGTEKVACLRNRLIAACMALAGMCVESGKCVHGGTMPV